MHHSRSGKKRFVTEILLHALKFKCKATAITDLCTSGEAWRLKSNLLQAISWVLFPHSLLSELPCKVKTKTAVETCYIPTITTFVLNSSSIWLNKQIFLHWTLQDSGIFEVFKFMVRSAQSDKPGVKWFITAAEKYTLPANLLHVKAWKWWVMQELWLHVSVKHPSKALTSHNSASTETTQTHLCEVLQKTNGLQPKDDVANRRKLTG